MAAVGVDGRRFGDGGPRSQAAAQDRIPHGDEVKLVDAVVDSVLETLRTPPDEGDFLEHHGVVRTYTQ